MYWLEYCWCFLFSMIVYMKRHHVVTRNLVKNNSQCVQWNNTNMQNTLGTLFMFQTHMNMVYSGVKASLVSIYNNVTCLTGCYSHLHLTPRLSPSHCYRLHLGLRSSRCPGRGAGWPAGSCTRPGCTGWSTGPAAGVGPGGSMQPAPGPAEGWPGGSPPPAEPRSLRQSAGRSSRGSSREGGPGETRGEDGR